MPEDIVKRLRAPPTVERHDGLLLEAADEIMQLRERVAWLRERAASLKRTIKETEHWTSKL